MKVVLRRALECAVVLGLSAMGVTAASPSAGAASSPVLVAVTDAPDPVPERGTVVFSAYWTSDSEEAAAKLLVCRTPSIGVWPPSCSDGAWAVGSYSTSRVATATYTTQYADIGTHDYYALVCDNDSHTCSDALHGTFTVVASAYAPTFVSDSCDAGENVITGFIKASMYIKARWQHAAATNTTSVCVAAEAYTGQHVGGRITIDGTAPGTTATVDDDAASVGLCGANANNIIVQSGMVLGGQPYWVHVTPAPVGSTDAVWVCVRFTSTLGVRLRFTTGAINLPGAFAADPPDRHVPAYSMGPWPTTGPSATCVGGLADGGYLDVMVRDARVAMYSWPETPTRRHYCVRADSVDGAGGRLTVDSAGVPTVTPTTSTAPCPFDIITRNEAPSYGLYISDPDDLPALPVSACAEVAGSVIGVTVSYSGDAVATWSPDPA